MRHLTGKMNETLIWEVLVQPGNWLEAWLEAWKLKHRLDAEWSSM